MSLEVTLTPIVDPGVPSSDGTDKDLPATYQQTFFDVNLGFIYTDDGTGAVQNITDISCSPTSPGVNFSVVSNNPVNYVVKISGSFSGSLFPETFTFKLNDGTTFVSSTGNVANWKAITRWSPPSVKSINTGYSFLISVPSASNVTHLTNQYVYWNLNPSLNTFSTLVATSV